MNFYHELPYANTFDTFEDMLSKKDFKSNFSCQGMIIDLVNDSEKMKKGVYILTNSSDPSDPNNWMKLEDEDEISLLDKEKLKILLRNTIDAYEDECDMNSAEHFVEKLKEETGITNEEYNLLFEGDRQILDDGSVVTCIEED